MSTTASTRFTLTRLDAIADIRPGRTPRKLDQYLAENPRNDRDIPFFKVGDMNNDPKRLGSARTFIARSELRVLGLAELPRGTIVFPKAGGAIATNKKRTMSVAGLIDLNCMGVVPRGVDGDYLALWLESLDLNSIADGSVLPQISKRRVAELLIPLPPLSEQRRIVEIHEEHLSHLDPADQLINGTQRRLDTFVAAGLWHATHNVEGPTVRLDSTAEVRLGRQRSPKNHSGSDMRPYLRAGNVDWDRLRLDDVKEMNFTSLEARVYELLPGDILVVEASGSAGEAGKSVVYEGEIPGACFQNTLLRVRTNSAQPEFIQKYLLADALVGKFIGGSRGVGINHIGRARLASWEVRMPSADDQRNAVARSRSLIESSGLLRSSLGGARARSSALRRSLLAAAFSGRLTRLPSDLERAEEAIA